MSASSKKKLRKEQNAAALTEKQLQQQKEAKKLKSQTAIFVAIIALVLVIGIGSLAVTAYNNSGISERSTVALTIGDHKLTSAEFSYFYFDAINTTYNEWYNTYGENTATYLALFEGLDITKPLDEQIYDQEKNITFAQYFIDLAVQKAINAYGLYDQAVAADNFSDLDKEYIDYMVNTTMENIKFSSKQGGFGSANKYLRSYYGNGATEQSYREYVNVLNVSNLFASNTYDAMTYTQDDLDAYEQEHSGEFDSYSYGYFYVSVNDHLVCTAGEDESGHEHTQEERDQALLNAEKTINAFEDSGISTIEEFNAFIQTLDLYKGDTSMVCSEYTDQLYSNITSVEMAEWLADSSRKPGDLKIFTKANESTNELGHTVSVPYGFDVVLYQGRNENDMKLANVRHILKQFTEPVTDPEGNTVYTDALKRKDEITKIMNEWVEGGATEEAFIELVAKNSDDTGSNLTGGLYENVYPGQMVSAFNDWCFDEARQPGDYEIVETEYGYHLMYFSGHSAYTFRNYMIENTLRNRDFNNWQQELVDAVKYTVNDTSKVKTNIYIGAN